MKITQQPLSIRLLFAIGLLMVTVPTLLKEYIAVPDFFRGMLAGVGLGMEVMGIVLMNRKRNTDTSC
ncbi:MAG TPA: hypothetical protein VGM63_21950 [Mucilaginibacter sp.]|jgi:hypothetical protein